jgi:hypothetical protein
MARRFKQYLIEVGSHPVINGVAAVLSVLAGSLASFFTGSIRASLALPSDPVKGTTFSSVNFQMTGEAVVFWCLILAAALLFAWSKFSDSATDNEHKGYVSKALHGLESMPPDAFLKRLADEYRVAHNELARLYATGPGQPPLSMAMIDLAITNVLRSVARVVQAYDGHVDRQYRISLMLFTRDGWDLIKLKRAVDVDTINRQAQLGCVESFRHLTIENEGPGKRISCFVNSGEFSFPVHRQRSPTDTANVLPGPPQAYVLNGMYECHSVIDLLADPTAFDDKNQLKRMSEFFAHGPGSGVQSFVSLAVPNNKWNSTVSVAGSEVSAVLHIEANERNVMKSASGFFWPVAQPFLMILSNLLALRSTVVTR